MKWLVGYSVVFIAILAGVYFWMISGKKAFLADSVNAYLPSSDGITVVHQAAKATVKAAASMVVHN